MRSPRNMLWSLITILVASYVGLAVLLFIIQGSLIYYPDLPSRELQATPGDLGLRYETVALGSKGGAKLHGWFLPVENPRGTLLFLHGNAGNISHRLDSLRLFHGLGLEVFIFDYQGYGNSEGRPSEQGTYRDSELAWQYLTRQKARSPQRIIIFGRSLGAAVAIDLASRHRAGGLIVESPFLSVPAMAAEIYPYLPARWLSRYRYDNLRKLPLIKIPLLMAHSPQDEIIPHSHGRRLFSVANAPKWFFDLHGGHNDGFGIDSSEYHHALDDFIRFCQQKEPSSAAS